MARHKVFIVFGIAWVAALLVSWWVYRRVAAPGPVDAVKVAAAAHELPVGRRLAATDLKLIAVARKDQPAGSFLQFNDVLDRAILVPVGPNEVLLERKLAPKQGGESLTAMIEKGRRALAVQVNEIIGVAGFVQPGSKVDVLFTRVLPNGDAASTTILQNIPVLAYGRSLQQPRPTGQNPQAAAAPSSSDRQATVTLLVTQEEAQKLALAMQRGKIQLALRNPLDGESPEVQPVYSEDLGIEEPVSRPGGRPAGMPRHAVPIGPFGPAAGLGPAAGDIASAPDAAAPRPPARPKDPKEGKVVIKVYRGTRVSEDIFP